MVTKNILIHSTGAHLVKSHKYFRDIKYHSFWSEWNQKRFQGTKARPTLDSPLALQARLKACRFW